MIRRDTNRNKFVSFCVQAIFATTVIAIPINDEAVEAIQPQDNSNNNNEVGRQGILEIPKQFATIIREALSESIERYLSTSTTTTVKPIGNNDEKETEAATSSTPAKVRQPGAQESNAIEVTTKQVPTKQPDTFLEEFLSNNFLSNFGDDEEEAKGAANSATISSAAPNDNNLLVKYKVRSTVKPRVVTSTASPLPTSSFSVVANAFPSDFDDGVSLVGIISTPAPSTLLPSVVRTTPNPPLVVTPDEQESEVTTTERFEAEDESTTTEEETITTTTADPEEEDEDETTTPEPVGSSTTTDPDEDEGDEEVN